MKKECGKECGVRNRDALDWARGQRGTDVTALWLKRQTTTLGPADPSRRVLIAPPQGMSPVLMETERRRAPRDRLAASRCTPGARASRRSRPQPPNRLLSLARNPLDSVLRLL